MSSMHCLWAPRPLASAGFISTHWPWRGRPGVERALDLMKLEIEGETTHFHGELRSIGAR